MKIFLNDIRHPRTDDWIIIRSSDDIKEYIRNNGMVDYISFDHDLGDDDTAMIFIKWLIDKDLDENIIKESFEYNIHSANPVGRDNIDSILKCYMKFKFRD